MLCHNDFYSMRLADRGATVYLNRWDRRFLKKLVVLSKFYDSSEDGRIKVGRNM
jgi:hypothetical protein